MRGKDLFDAALWKDELSTSTFYTFMASLRRKIRDDVKRPTATHKFIRILRDGRRLVRCYTQNIDGLEAREDLSMDIDRGTGNKTRFTKKALEKPRHLTPTLPGSISDGGCEVVPLHGDLDLLRCTLCQQKSRWGENDNETILLGGHAPECQSCAIQDQDRRDRGKRGIKVGSLRPNIVLYGEEHPSADILSKITTHDLSLAPDVLLILGTSLQVHGLKILVKEFAKSVHAKSGRKGKVIFVNLTKPSESAWKETIDYWVSMDCDDWVKDLRHRKPEFWQKQKTLSLHVTKPNKLPLPKLMSTGKRDYPETENKENLVTNDIISPLSEPIPTRLAGKAKTPLLERPEIFNLREPQISTPRKALTDDPDPTFQDQLPTPPSSSHKHSLNQSNRKRPHIHNDDFEQASAETPSKRKRTAINIYHDSPIRPKRTPNAKLKILGTMSKGEEKLKSTSGQPTRPNAVQIRVPLGARVDREKLAELMRRKQGGGSSTLLSNVL